MAWIMAGWTEAYGAVLSYAAAVVHGGNSVAATGTTLPGRRWHKARSRRAASVNHDRPATACGVWDDTGIGVVIRGEGPGDLLRRLGGGLGALGAAQPGLEGSSAVAAWRCISGPGRVAFAREAMCYI
ncbi:hypothetical protein Vretimale_13358 [Volvox reticuliferus]|uniref:Uncharacterized protein n=1 Tax=Volvox reticuliferus TaxID=1737510 RepID=A0A8J4LU00_9CHLO|nr:hypothetical protein Vretimale_13358 [Volvox reticuliferus]